jgi:20S proteasome alpha/beta subunit
MSFGNATFGGFVVGRTSRLPLNDLRSQARRPRYIQKVQKQAACGIAGFRADRSVIAEFRQKTSLAI